MQIGNLANYWIVAAFAAYYLFAWTLVGRKRTAGSIAVCYQSPQSLSPAAVRYLYTMTSDGRTYAAIIAQLAAKKLLAIVPDHEKGIIMLERLAHEHHATRGLPEEEAAVFLDLFEWDDGVELKQPQMSIVDEVNKILNRQLRARYMTRNFGWVIAGSALTAAATLWLGVSSVSPGEDDVDSWMIRGLLALIVTMFGLAGYWVWDTFRLAIVLAFRGIYRRRTLPQLLFFLTFLSGLWWFQMQILTPRFAIITTLMIVLNTFVGPTLCNYTSDGRRLRDEIEGFRRFLAGVEQDRLQQTNRPGARAPIDPEMIPYAIALDLREAWGDQLGMITMLETGQRR